MAAATRQGGCSRNGPCRPGGTVKSTSGYDRCAYDRRIPDRRRPAQSRPHQQPRCRRGDRHLPAGSDSEALPFRQRIQPRHGDISRLGARSRADTASTQPTGERVPASASRHHGGASDLASPARLAPARVAGVHRPIISGPDRSRSCTPISPRELCDSGTRSFVTMPTLEYRQGLSLRSRQILVTPCRTASISASA